MTRKHEKRQTDWPENGRTVFVSRHPGTIDWLNRQGIAGDEWWAHLDPAMINPGDTVIGTLPLHLASEVARKGARMVGLVVDTPPVWRGRELSADQIAAANGRLHVFEILDRGPWNSTGIDAP